MAGEVIQLNDRFYATCECGSQNWKIMVDGPAHRWTNITGTKCSECGGIIEWIRAKKEDDDGDDRRL